MEIKSRRMQIRHRHRWDVTAAEAIAVQQRLRGAVVAVDNFSRIDSVAGVDVGFEEQGKVTRAAVAVLSFPELVLQEQAVAQERQGVAGEDAAQRALVGGAGKRQGDRELGHVGTSSGVRGARPLRTPFEGAAKEVSPASDG